MSRLCTHVRKWAAHTSGQRAAQCEGDIPCCYDRAKKELGKALAIGDRSRKDRISTPQVRFSAGQNNGSAREKWIVNSRVLGVPCSRVDERAKSMRSRPASALSKGPEQIRSQPCHHEFPAPPPGRREPASRRQSWAAPKGLEGDDRDAPADRRELDGERHGDN